MPQSEVKSLPYVFDEQQGGQCVWSGTDEGKNTVGGDEEGGEVTELRSRSMLWLYRALCAIVQRLAFTPEETACPNKVLSTEMT